MTKTAYLVVPEKLDEDELLMAIIDPNEDIKPDIFLNKELAEEHLSYYLEKGFKYKLKTLILNLD